MRGSAIGIVAVLLASSFLAGCSSGGGHASRTTDGPLAFASDTSGFLLDKPSPGGPGSPDESGVWWATFGGFVLCTKDPDRHPVVERVRFETSSPQSREINSLFRHIPPESEWVKADKYGEEIAWLPMLALVGRPSDRFDGRQTLGGTISPLPEGPITRECSDIRFKEPFKESLVELIVEARIGPEGACIRKTYVDYRVGNDLYTVALGATLGGRGEVSREGDPAACGE